VARWTTSGKLSAVRTLGGHRRFYAAEVETLLEGSAEEHSNEPDKQR